MSAVATGAAGRVGAVGAGRFRWTTAAGCAVLLLAATATGCSDGSQTEVAGSPQAIAAAVLAHHDGQLDAVAPLFRRDQVRRGDVAVELAFDRPEGGNTHVRVVVAQRLPFGEGEDPCDDTSWECVDISTRDADATMLYEAGHPEEDPGVVVAWATWEDHTVWAYANGPYIAPDDEGGPDPEVRALGDALGAIVTDPAVGLRTSESYAEAGEEICADAAWLRWYGDGSGAPRPEDYRNWCA